jgi:hypothetical protein
LFANKWSFVGLTRIKTRLGSPSAATVHLQSLGKSENPRVKTYSGKLSGESSFINEETLFSYFFPVAQPKIASDAAIYKASRSNVTKLHWFKLV